ncbi:MAG: alpha/beta fold hydrolase [Myxococcota bacterium]
MPWFTHDGLRLHYVDHGTGTPIVLVHGLLWSSRMFVRLRRALPDQRVILLNLRGHGPSDRPTDASRYSWAAFAQDVLALLDHLGLERAVVGGLSLGANVALEVAMAAPDRCAALVREVG